MNLITNAVLLVALLFVSTASAVQPVKKTVFELSAGPIRVSSIDKVNFGGRGHIENETVNLANSVLRVFGPQGTVVSSTKLPFWLADGVVSSGTWDAGGGPTIHKLLPKGKYSAVWAVDGHNSNRVNFAISNDPPPTRLLEPYSGGIFGECMILHVYNLRADPIRIPTAIEQAKVMIDGKITKSNGVVWSGPGDLGHGQAYSWTINLQDQFGVAIKGRHKFSVLFAGEWSNLAVFECQQQ
jgi:hypothetical protein